MIIKQGMCLLTVFSVFIFALIGVVYIEYAISSPNLSVQAHTAHCDFYKYALMEP